MASVNEVTIIGNLGRDPESRYAPDGNCMTSLTLATTEKWKDKATGEKKEHTEWHRVTFFGKLAEIAKDYLKKGASVYVKGSLRTRKYTDKDGVEKYATDIKGDIFQMLDKRTDSGSQSRQPSHNTGASTPNPNSYDDSDIPF
jgi:single-strand DNA-binding protein